MCHQTSPLRSSILASTRPVDFIVNHKIHLILAWVLEYFYLWWLSSQRQGPNHNGKELARMKIRSDSALGGGSLQTRFSHIIQRGKILAPPGARDCPNRNTMFIKNALAKMINCPWRRYVALFFVRLPFFENTILWFSFFNGCHAVVVVCVKLYVKTILLHIWHNIEAEIPFVSFHKNFSLHTYANLKKVLKKTWVHSLTIAMFATRQLEDYVANARLLHIAQGNANEGTIACTKLIAEKDISIWMVSGWWEKLFKRFPWDVVSIAWNKALWNQLVGIVMAAEKQKFAMSTTTSMIFASIVDISTNSNLNLISNTWSCDVEPGVVACGGGLSCGLL